MNTRPIELPNFSDPPVVETVLSVQFEPLVEFRAAHFGLYWEMVKERFPRTEERAELVPVLEQFPRIARAGVGIRLESIETPPAPRVWFMNADGTELIQLQRDRFIKNWRKTSAGDKYPRYKNVKAGFEQEFSGYLDFVKKQGIGSVNVNQCEVTYVNHIVSGNGWTTHSDADLVFSCWSQPPEDSPGRAEEISFQASFIIYDDCDSSVGRLHANMQSAYLSSGAKEVFVLNLTARGQIGSGTEFFDRGRYAIVKSFKSLTTPAMHKIWGLGE